MAVNRNASALAQKLVAPPQQLAPQRARSQTVAMPTALSPKTRYGTIPPGLAQSQRFTGGVVQRQPVSQNVPPPDYRAPYYANLGLTLPRPTYAPTQVAALGSRLNALLTPPPAAGPAPSPTQSRSVGTGLTFGPQSPPNVINGPPGTPVSSGANGSTNVFTPGTTVSSSGVSLSQLLATAAQRGTRLPGGYYQQ